MADMMKGVSKARQVVAGWSLFAGTHLLMSHPPVRSYLVSSLGEDRFKAVYSAVSLATLGPTTVIYARNAGAGSLGYFTRLTQKNALVRGTGNGLKLAGLVTCGQAFSTPNPVKALPTDEGDNSVATRGIYRITRHPLFLGFALGGLGSILTRGYAVDVAYFAGYPIFWLIGSAHQDFRQQQADMPAALYEQTSLLPFAAIIEGRNTLQPVPEELNKPTLATALISTFFFWL